MEFLQKMAARMYEIRKEMKLNQQQMGEIMGVSRASYSLYENGKLPIDVVMLEKLRQKTQFCTDYILGYSDDKYIECSPEDDVSFSQVEEPPPVEEGYSRITIPADELFAGNGTLKIDLNDLIQNMIEDALEKREAKK